MNTLNELPSSHSIFQDRNKSKLIEGSDESSGSSIIPPPKIQFFGLVPTQSQSQSQYNNNDFDAFNGGSQKENTNTADVDMDKGLQIDQPVIADSTANATENHSPIKPKSSPLSTPSTTPTMVRPVAHSSGSRPGNNMPKRKDSFLDILPDTTGANRILSNGRPHNSSPQSSADEEGFDDANAKPERVYVEDTPAASEAESEHHDESEADEEELGHGFPCAQPRQDLDLDLDLDLDGEDFEMMRNDPAEEDLELPDDYDFGPSQEEPPQPIRTQSPDFQQTQITESTQILEEPIPEETGPSVTDPVNYGVIHRTVVLCSDIDSIKRRLRPLNIPGLNLATFRPDDYITSVPPSQSSVSKGGTRDGSIATAPSHGLPGPSNYQETQPSFDEEYTKRRRMPPPSRPANDDSMDVVPDSDSRSFINPSPSSTFQKRTTPPPAKIAKPADQSTSTEDDDSRDIAPDSLELEEKERNKIEKQRERSFARRQEEEEDDSSDDIHSSTKVFSKAKAASKPKSTTPKPMTKPISAPKVSTAGNKRKRPATPDEVVPSSLPSDNMPPPSTTKRITRSAKGKGKAPATARKSVRRPKKRQDTEALSGDEEAEDEGDLLPAKQEREATVLLREPGPSKPKRARYNAKMTPSIAGLVKREPGASMSRSTARVSSDSFCVPANIPVLAQWHGDKMFYHAILTEIIGPKRGIVEYDDGNSSHVDLDSLRAFRLEVGDYVVIQRADQCVDQATVVDSHVSEAGNVVVQLDGVKKTETVPLSCLRVAAKNVKELWEGRRLTREDLAENPSGLLAGYAFVVTWSGKDDDGRQNIMDILAIFGAKVCDNWNDLVEWDGAFRGDSEWCIEKGKATWTGPDNIRNVFLLANAPNEKPKYLTALALGIPCVHVEWIRASNKGKLLDWRPYLLPAGVYKERSVSQLVDLNWGEDSPEVILDNPIAMKLLQGKKVVVVGASFMPKREPDGADGHHNVPLILFSMGAEMVKVIKTVPKKQGALRQFDFVVYSQTKPRCDHDNVVEWQKLKSSLIAGRFVDL